MSRVAINTGSVANDGTGDSLRIAGGIINDNFAEIYSQFGDGTDLTPTWDKTAVGVNTTSNVGIGTTNPRFGLEVGAVGASGTSLWVNGNARVTGILTVGSSSIVLDGNANKILVGSGISFDGNTGIISATAFYAGGSIISGGGGGGLNYWVSGATGITTTANVGVATNSAPSALTVGGNSLFTGIATFRNNVTLANLTSSSNTLRFGSNSYLDQSTSDVLTFQINTGTDSNSTDGSFVFRTTEPNTSPIPDFQLDALRVYSRGDYWNGLVRVYTDLHVDDNAFVGGDLQVGAASTLIGAGSTLGSFKVGAGGTVITTTSTGLVGIGTTNPTNTLTVGGGTSTRELYVTGVTTFGPGLGGNQGDIDFQHNGETRAYWDGSAGTLNFTDNGGVTFGDSDDVRISWDGTDWLFTKSTTAGSIKFVKSTGSENIAVFSNDGPVELYYDNSKKFETVGAGVTVTGTTFTDQLSVTGIATIQGLTIKGNSTSYNDNVVITQHPASTFAGNRNVVIGDYSFTTPGAAGENVAIGYYALNVVGNNDTLNTYNGNTAVGAFAGQSATTTLRNTFIGNYSGRYITTGGENTILGGFDGNQNGLDIRTSSNNVVLSDGVGNIRFYANSSGNVGIGTTNATEKLTIRGGDISVGINTSEGLILTSPNGTKYRLIVANDGILSTTAV
jgi:hypothetical protein